jgi:glycerol-3-phosphate O-acyltransferase/dihydroxyacetone phosphate acyltransferase
MTLQNPPTSSAARPAGAGNPFVYDLIVWMFTIVFDMFFRKIQPRGAWRIPKKGPIIFVAAPHANQFVDPMILMQQVRYSSGRRVSFLIAANSAKRRFIGFVSRATAAIGVVRAQDNLVRARGTIYVDENGLNTRILGKSTQFTKQCMAGGYIALPSSLGMVEISEIVSDTELVVRKEFKSEAAIELLKKGTTYKVADRVDHSQMYHSVFDHLHRGECIGIFPEGGSHDRPELLPLKAGVAIMALGALAQNRDCNVQIVPCGMNYFHAHKFRSRAVIEFGAPMTIAPELIDQYVAGGECKRNAVKTVLDQITYGLKSVTLTCTDYDTLMAIQAARRLYQPRGKDLPLPVVVELTRRFMEGYNHYKDDPRIIHLRGAVATYNRQLSDLGIRDHQVESTSLGPHIILGRLMYRSLKLVVLAVASLPGAILFAPIFVATKQISKRKAAAALKASSVKIQARDVIATWKVLVAIGLTPLVYTFYGLMAAWLSYKYELVPRTKGSAILVTLVSYIILPAITYAALVIGETGMDIFKSLRPLALALNPTRKNTLAKLKATRIALTAEITELVNMLGPDLYPDFDHDRLVKLAKKEVAEEEYDRLPARQRSVSNVSIDSELSRISSESDLAGIPLFSYSGTSEVSSGVQTPAGHSRGASDVLISDVESERTERSTGTFQTEVTRRIRAAMAERQKRKNEEEDLK